MEGYIDEMDQLQRTMLNLFSRGSTEKDQNNKLLKLSEEEASISSCYVNGVAGGVDMLEPKPNQIFKQPR